MSPHIIQRNIHAHPLLLAGQQAHRYSAGEEKKIAILFADIRNFTTFSEALPPYDVIHVLNRYFAQMGKVIQQHGGFINNYMGTGYWHYLAQTMGWMPHCMLEGVEKLKLYLQGVYGMS